MQASPPQGGVKGAAVGFFAGVRALFGGAFFVVSTPRVWGWAIVPVLAATILFVGFASVAGWGGAALADRIVLPSAEAASAAGEELSGLALATMWLLRVLFWLVGIVVAFVVAMSLAQPVSGFALDALAREQEVALGGRTWPDVPALVSAGRALRVSLAALAVGLPILAALALLTFLVPPVAVVTVPAKFLVTGLLAAYDLLDTPLSLRGLGVRERLAFMRRQWSAVVGFGVAAAVILLVPGAALFLLPFGVAGAARLVVAADRQPP